MSQVAKEYARLKLNHSAEDWQSAEFLLKLAIRSEKSGNLPLAFRLLQRAHNLAPEDKTIVSSYEATRAKLTNLRAASEVKKANKSGDVIKAIKRKMNVNPTKVIKETTKRLDGFSSFFKNNSLLLCVFFPVLLFFVYLEFFASERFESRVRLLVQQPDAMSTLSPEMALLGGLSGTTASPDAAVLQTYISSLDMLNYLEETLGLRKHYSSQQVDVISRLASDAKSEEFLEYYQNFLSVEVAADTGIVSIYVQAFEPEFSLKVATEILEKSEWFINEIGHELAKGQMDFVNKEHELAVSNLKDTQTNLLSFQNQHGLLDPETEGAAMQGIAYSLETQIAQNRARLKSLKAVMSPDSPEVIQTQNLLTGLTSQLEEERLRLSETELENLSVSQVMATFAELKVEVEMALQAYAASLVSIEKTRVEAYRQMKFLVTIEKPTHPESSSYPKVFYNVALVFVVLLLVYGILRIVTATILELK